MSSRQALLRLSRTLTPQNALKHMKWIIFPLVTHFYKLWPRYAADILLKKWIYAAKTCRLISEAVHSQSWPLIDHQGWLGFSWSLDINGRRRLCCKDKKCIETRRKETQQYRKRLQVYAQVERT